MTFQIGIVLFIVLIMIIALVLEFARPDIIVFISLAFLLLIGIITPEEALQGFSNQGLLTIGLLFIIAGAVEQSGLVNQLVRKVMGEFTTYTKSLVKMMVPVTVISAFLNNTPVVVMFMSDLRKWSSRYEVSSSKFLLPLSYAAIFGGSITLIGTSTNLVVNGLLLNNHFKGLSMFELSIVGIPAAILGILYMSVYGYKLLPQKNDLEESFQRNSSEYLAEVKVEEDSTIVGKTIEQAGLRNLTGVYLIEVIRKEERISPVSSSEKITAKDRLIFTGMVSTIVELQKIKGLTIETNSELNLDQLINGDSKLIEAVVSHHSTLLHKTIKENNFRSRFDAAVVAVQRRHERIQSKIGDIILKPGDTLLLLTGKDFYKKYAHNDDFYLISSVPSPKILDHKKSKMTVLFLIAMILLVSLNIVSMFKAALITVIMLILTKIITPEEVKKYVHFNVLLLIASALGIGFALAKTGAAAYIASFLLKLTSGWHIFLILIVIYLLTNLLTEIITNSAAAVIMFPISVSLANQIGIDPLPFIITLTIAASASFVTPIGYQTNLIVYGPGGYRFTDYIKVGLPLSLIYMLVTVVIVNLVWIN